MIDRVGLGWRSELAAGIFENLEEIDVVEVIADDYFKDPRPLKTLAAYAPVILHGVGLGLASSLPVEQKRLDKLARLMDTVAPEVWSEHMSFVRAGGREIGHLAAPPRTLATVEGALENLERVRNSVGSLPVLENIATLVEPPLSVMSEPEWCASIARDSGMLLDLHNLYANAVNFRRDPSEFLQEFDLANVRMVHLSGGHWIPAPGGGTRLLDDHVHDVPDAVFDLLGELASRAAQPLTVIIERDGDYPKFDTLLAQVRRAREVLQTGRMNVRAVV